MKKIEIGDLVSWNGQWGEVVMDFLNDQVHVAFDAEGQRKVLHKRDLKLVCKRKDRLDYI